MTPDNPGDPTAPAGRLRAAARIDLRAIEGNVRRIREIAGRSQVMAVVKADGYGHGLLPSARAALAGGADWLGVAFVEEALALRAAGVDARLLCWLAAPGEQLAKAILADVDLSASAPWMIDEIAAAAVQAGKEARVHCKVDTGLSRAGATATDWPELIDAALRAQGRGVVRVVGLWSHLAHGDDPQNPTMSRQIEEFTEAIDIAQRAGVTPEVRHLANSGGALHRPDARFDLVRVGIAAYGLAPAPKVARPSDLGLRPAMTLTARLALTKSAPAGAGVSYGHRYHTPEATTLGLVPLGYADGVPRAAGNTVEVLVRGAATSARRAIAGTVCMDQFVVDLGAVNDGAFMAGDEVLLFGPGDSGEPTAEDWAAALGTISYEVVTRIGPRVPRVYQP
ncbi:MAG TPA: alanine racemase [Acidothermaceae bacterium]